MSNYKDLTVSDIKRIAKLHASKSGIQLAKAQNEIAVNAGYSDFTDALRKLSISDAIKKKSIFNFDAVELAEGGTLSLYAHNSESIHNCDFIMAMIKKQQKLERMHHIVVLRDSSEVEYFMNIAGDYSKDFSIICAEGLDETWKYGLEATEDFLELNDSKSVALYLSTVSQCSEEENSSGLAVAAQTNLRRIAAPSYVSGMRTTHQELTWDKLMMHKYRVRLYLTTNSAKDYKGKTYIKGGEIIQLAASKVWLKTEDDGVELIKNP